MEYGDILVAGLAVGKTGNDSVEWLE